MIRLLISIGLICCILQHSSFGINYRDDVLIFSNYPESIQQSGVVYDGVLSHQKTRFSYYHLNNTKRRLYLSLHIKNLESYPVTLNVIQSVAQPGLEGLAVGHAATVDYLNRLIRNDPQRMVIQPGETRSFLMQPFYPQFVIGGYFLFEKPAEDRLNLNVAVLNDRYDSISRIKTGHPYFSCGVYDRPYFDIDASYDFSSPIEEIRFGDVPFLSDTHSAEALKGNYAAIYKYNIRLKNVYAFPVYIDFLFSPVAGAARGTFVVDGQLHQNARVKNYINIIPEVIQTFQLNPMETRDIDIFSIPEPGAFYPLNLVFRRRFSSNVLGQSVVPLS